MISVTVSVRSSIEVEKRARCCIEMDDIQTNYNWPVRRLLAISLLLLFNFSLISPLFALGANTGTNLPACCRRSGAHHCSMGVERRGQLAGEAGAKAPTIRERCPYLPKVLSVMSTAHFVLHATSAVFAGVVTLPASVPQAREKRHLTLDRSHLKRGPPFLRA
jgi:hypothetical protein